MKVCEQAVRTNGRQQAHDDEVQLFEAAGSRRLARGFGIAIILLLAGLAARPSSSAGQTVQQAGAAESPRPTLGHLLGRNDTIVVVGGEGGPAAYRVLADGSTVEAPDALRDLVGKDAEASAAGASRTLMYVDGGWDDFSGR